MLINLRNIDFKNKKLTLNKKGFCVLKNIISLETLKEIELETLKISWGQHKEAEVNIIHKENKSVLSSSHNLVLWSDTFKNLYANVSLKKIYKLLLGEQPNPLKTINSSYFFKSKYSKDIKPHQDNAYFNLESGIDCLTFYIPIHKQSKKNGTIYYFSGSHELGNIEHEPKGNLGASMCIKQTNHIKKLSKYKIEYLNLNPGDVVIHNALVVHGTLPNTKDKLCEACNFTFFGEKNKINELAYKEYKNHLKLFLESKNLNPE